MSATRQPTQAGPSPLLYNILVTFLCPLFLGPAAYNYDLEIARAAASDTLKSFDIRTDWDLILAVQIVCLNLAAIGSLGLSMGDDLPVNTVLRCRYNANALQRSADRARDRMEKRQARELAANAPEAQPLDETAVLEAMRGAAQAQHRAAEARARLTGEKLPEQPLMQLLREGTPGAESFASPAVPAPASAPAAPSAAETPAATRPVSAAPSTAASPAAASSTSATLAAAQRPEAAPGQTPDPTTEAGRRDMHGKVIWAGAMAKVATELAEELPRLPPHEQRLHQIRINALCSVSQELAAGRGKTWAQAFPPLPSAAPRSNKPTPPQPSA